MKKVYIGMSADIIHEGHLNIIKTGRDLGEVIIGLLTDEAIASYKRIPMMNFNQRKMIIENIKGVDQVIAQETLDYSFNLKKIKPDYVVHGDDWKKGVQKKTRDKVKKILNEWGGRLIEPKYTDGISSTKIIESYKNKGVTSDYRLKSLKRLLHVKPVSTFLEAHNGITGIVVENTKVEVEDKEKEFDGIWLSSLTVSTSMGKPDNELVDFSSRFNVLDEIIEVTTKPIIVDADTGGKIEHFQYNVRTLERMGVSAVIIEDKIGYKRNSLFGTDVSQKQDSIENFCEKIKQGNDALITDEFMIIARIESLILKNGLDDALKRAKSYINAGASGIMIHSKEKDGEEIKKFCYEFNSFRKDTPLVVVPSTFSHLTEKELADLGANIVIYGNHLIRSAYPAMLKTAKSILRNGRSKEASNKYCMPIKEIINLIPE